MAVGSDGSCAFRNARTQFLSHRPIDSLSSVDENFSWSAKQELHRAVPFVEMRGGGNIGGGDNSDGPVVLSAADVTSTSHLMSWILLAFAAGSTNVAAFLTSDRFVTHITGIVARSGMDFGVWNLMIDYAIVFSCFVAGAALSAIVIHSKRSTDRAWIAQAMVSVTIAIVAITGHMGVFGPFLKSSAERPLDFVLLSVLAFAMGAQNAGGAIRTSMIVRTTHLTGPSTDLAIGLGILFTGGLTSERRRELIAGVRLRIAKILAFAVGAAVTVPLAHKIGFGTFWLPAIASAIPLAMSFRPVKASPAQLTLPRQHSDETAAALSLPPPV